jgi:hypothetical protein
MRVPALIVMALIAAAPARAQSAGGILDVGRERAQRAIVTLDEKLPEIDAKPGLESPMTLALKGVLADLRGKAFEDLRACVPPNPMLGDPTTGERVCVVHLFAANGAKRKEVEVVRVKGGFVAVELVPENEGKSRPQRAELRAERFSVELDSWPVYHGGFDASDVKEPRGEVFELAKPYAPGRFTMDQATMGERFLRGGKTTVAGADRELDKETLHCRLPRDYDPRRPAGLLVWIDPGMSGKTPGCFVPALDELNLVFVGAADAGNNRLVSNREQLALDGVATVSRRFHIDPRRVYITGMSGGGRVSAMMLACFPDVFTGAVPIVGLSCHEAVPTGMGQFWPRGYVRPGSDMWNLFRKRRMGAITGSKDFNQVEMQHATDILRRDGAAIRLWDIEHMAHELPTAAVFSEAMKWVDEPWQLEHQKEREAAKKAWDQVSGRVGRDGGGSPDEATHRLLVKVTEAGPWTEEAWKAAGALGLGK